MSINSTLNERGERYGDFRTQATLSQTLSYVWRNHYYQVHGKDPANLPPFINEGIEMIFHKLARIANGDPLFADSYTDISGYAQLIVDGLRDYPGATFSEVITTVVPVPTVAPTTNPSEGKEFY